MSIQEIQDAGIELLANAIIRQACDDYRDAYLGNYSKPVNGGKSSKNKSVAALPNTMMKECERFFASEWFKQLTTLDHKRLMHELQIDVLEDTIAMYDDFLNNATEYHIDLWKQLKGNKRESHTIPPRLMDGFIQVIGLQQEYLNIELERVRDEMKH